MFCGNCGTKSGEDTKFCGNCGVAVELPVASELPKTNTNEKQVANFSIGNIIHFFAPAGGSAKLEVGGRILSEDLVFKGLATALVAVLLFLPFLVHGFSISGYSNEVSRNFFQHIFGTASTFLSIFILLIPVALFCLFHFKDKIQIDANLRLIAVIALAVFGFIMPLIVRAQILRPLRAVQEFAFTNVIYWVNPAIGFILTLLLYLLVAAVAFGFVCAASKNRA